MSRIGNCTYKKCRSRGMNRLEKMDVLIKFCAVPRSSSEMMDAIGAISVNSFRKDYLIPLQKDGSITRAGTGRSTKYVRVESKKQ